MLLTMQKLKPRTKEEQKLLNKLVLKLNKGWKNKGPLISNESKQNKLIENLK